RRRATNAVRRRQGQRLRALWRHGSDRRVHRSALDHGAGHAAPVPVLMSSSSGLFAGIYARGGVAEQVSDEAWVQAMLDVEAALGGEALDAGEIDIDELGREAADHASPVVPLAQRFPDTHAGATSQDILDTAMMLVAKRALEPMLGDARAGADA